MLHELLVHSMCRTHLSIDQILDINLSFSSRALELNVSGCMIHHKGEILHYITGNESSISKFQSFHNSLDSFEFNRKLFEGELSNPCCTEWCFATEEAGEIEEKNVLSIDGFIKKADSCEEVSVGLKLFLSVADIMFSEKLYRFD